MCSSDLSGSSLVYLGGDTASASVRPQTPINQEEVKAEIAAAAEAMGAAEFTATINDRCRKCPVKKVCPIQPNGRTVLDGN